MKYIVLVGDGMADRPLKELDDKTPLEVARVTYMNRVASSGCVGTALIVPERFQPASDVANLALLGYDPDKYYTGRGPLEAANMNITLQPEEIAFRCNLVTVSEDERMIDYSAGHISNKEARILIKHIDSKLGSKAIKFYAGISYRHLAVINFDNLNIDGQDIMNTLCTPPHDIINRPIAKYMPRGAAGGFLTGLMAQSRDLLNYHDVNKVRIDLGENPGNMIWFWGQGVKPDIPSFYQEHKLRGSIISAVDLIKGLGKIIGFNSIDVPGATGYYDTDYEAKARYAIAALKDCDFVYVHVEAPDEAGHNGDVRAKITAIENFDRFVVGTVLDHFESSGEDFRILVLPDHATPVSIRTHARDPIPFAMCGTGIKKDNVEYFNEKAAKESRLFIQDGYKILELFLKP